MIKNIISKNRVLLFLCHIEPKCKNYVCCRKEWPLACGQYKDKHNAELRKTAPAAKVSCHKCSYTSPPPPKYGQKWQFHTIFLDTFLKIIFKKKLFLGQNVWPVARSRTENTRKTPKNTFKKGHKMVKNQNFEKLLKKCLDIDLKIIFSKHYVPMPKTMYMRWKIR